MVRRAWVLIKHFFKSYQYHHGPQHAAAISYYVLFSLAPLALLTLSIIGVVLTDQARADVVDEVLDAVPLSQTEGRDAVEDAVSGAGRIGGPLAAVGLVFTLWTASSMFAAIRRSLNVIWDVSEPRPWFQGKLVDFAQIGLLLLVLVASLVATGVLRVVREVSADAFGPLAGKNPLWEIPPVVLPGALSFLTFLLIYRIVPEVRPQWRHCLAGAVVATLLFEALKNTFALYVANFSNYDVVYGSLAGVLLFLFFVHLAASILLAGAEVTRISERLRAGEFNAELFPQGPGTPLTTQAVRAVKGLFVRQ
jgi:membrane protein